MTETEKAKHVSRIAHGGKARAAKRPSTTKHPHTSKAPKKDTSSKASQENSDTEPMEDLGPDARNYKHDTVGFKNFLHNWRKMKFADAMNEASIYYLIAVVEANAGVKPGKQTAEFNDNDYSFNQLIEDIYQAGIKRCSMEITGDENTVQHLIKNTADFSKMSPDELAESQRLFTAIKPVQDRYSKDIHGVTNLSNAIKDLVSISRTNSRTTLVNAWRLAYMLLNYRTNDIIGKHVPDNEGWEYGFDETNTTAVLDEYKKQADYILDGVFSVAKPYEQTEALFYVLSALNDRFSTPSLTAAADTVIQSDGALGRLGREAALLQIEIEKKPLPEEKEQQINRAAVIRGLEAAKKMDQTTPSVPAETFLNVKEQMATMDMGTLAKNLSNFYEQLSQSMTYAKRLFDGKNSK